jgi:hypothetical protein
LQQKGFKDTLVKLYGVSDGKQTIAVRQWEQVQERIANQNLKDTPSSTTIAS